MNSPDIPSDTPFREKQRTGISGYFAGLRSKLFGKKSVNQTDNSDALTLDILYGSQTGNAWQLADDAAKLATANGLKPKVAGLEDISMEKLATMERLIIVTSTYGEGEMPDNAQLFWEALSASSAPRLEQLRYGVLALGDTIYDDFCQAGKQIDARLEELGAIRLIERVDCDVEFEDPAAEWLQNTIALIDDREGKPGEPVETNQAASELSGPQWCRKNPYPADVIENRLLSAEDSAKEIRHFVFDLGDSGIEYEVGDSLNVIPANHQDLVASILTRLNAAADHKVDGFDEPLGELLAHRFEIMTPSKELISHIEQLAGHAEFSRAFHGDNKEHLDNFLWGRDTLDLLNLNAEIAIDPAEFISWLRPLQHRAYSIASSPKAHPGEVHLTVAAVRWQFEEREHRGVASTWLSDSTHKGDKINVFVSPNKGFRLPENNDAPVIMVGPGTGIAPFRAFLEERRKAGAKGKNWLFFGDQHQASDFIYKDELEAMVEQGVLHRLDLAFSRDQSEKIYVQTRMRENAETLYAWLEDGAYFYVCGDATHMAKDVDATLIDVVKAQGNLDNEAAVEYVNQLKREKRYLRDVY